jgi:hypothetical protein
LRSQTGGALAGNAVANTVEAPEFLDVDVDPAWLLALVAAHRIGRFDILQP